MPLGRLTLPNISQAFNRPGHGLSDAALAGTVRDLFAQGFIDAMLFDSAKCGESGERAEVRLDDAALDAALRERTSLRERVSYRTYYGLTARGAAVWEAFAQPDWSLFLDGSLQVATRVWDRVRPERADPAQVLQCLWRVVRGRARRLRVRSSGALEGDVLEEAALRTSRAVRRARRISAGAG